MSVVVDASLYVAAALPTDVHNADSKLFLTRIESDGESIICPAILLSECAGAISRQTGDPATAKGTAALLLSNANLTIAETTVVRANDAATIAADHSLRGADSLYVQTAQEFAGTLITWDGEMLLRAATVVPTMTPTAWLAATP